ncbi:hypothetical protein ERS043882_00033 [Streptococcus pneumoniae]|nr:hypothetical protein SPCG_0003 [Streptococcus pneumoniae CGSP14]AFS42095.1 hypothetical protein HMPREF1038_00003 [Streptococcus pneumoniae gamPNI0373]ELU60787.1 hypothetical protein PCS125219_00013 [Streptococcus pneumoniae PCS125219]ELU61571.1 hypothetical protein PCS70012_02113 [Streptococcus pneumoniae PCS70012]ELU61864.1 hypothetical protein PNI0002_02164 [Streptococcus pneumoniae PNI0002]ELU65575.1 hypothetical protein PNI0006_02138 [Streptococcus pneumoniae PNI0006]ELU67944.1 hypothe
MSLARLFYDIIEKEKESSMYQVGNFVEMKKPHACTIKSTGKKANRWEITRVGADIKIKCSNCEHVVMMGRYDFERKMNKIID